MVKTSPEQAAPARVERRRKLMEMAKASFPNGPPKPFTLVDSMSQDEFIPFIRTSVRIYSEDGSVSQEFPNEWCLWDSGAHISYILSGLLRPEVKSPDAPEDGYVQAEIR